MDVQPVGALLQRLTPAWSKQELVEGTTSSLPVYAYCFLLVIIFISDVAICWLVKYTCNINLSFWDVVDHPC